MMVETCSISLLFIFLQHQMLSWDYSFTRILSISIQLDFENIQNMYHKLTPSLPHFCEPHFCAQLYCLTSKFENRRACRAPTAPWNAFFIVQRLNHWCFMARPACWRRCCWAGYGASASVTASLQTHARSDKTHFMAQVRHYGYNVEQAGTTEIRNTNNWWVVWRSDGRQ